MITTEKKKSIIEMYRSGVTMAAIGEANGVSRQYVHRILVNEGIERRSYNGVSEHRMEPSEKTLRIASMYKDGLSLETIGREIGLSITTVRYHLKRAGVKPRPSGVRPLLSNETCELIRAIVSDGGQTHRELAVKYSVSASTISRIIAGDYKNHQIERGEP